MKDTGWEKQEFPHKIEKNTKTVSFVRREKIEKPAFEVITMYDRGNLICNEYLKIESPIALLPEDILTEICNHLRQIDLISISVLSKYYNR